MHIPADILREICKLTCELVKLRQAECKHLAVENIADDIFRKLLAAYVCVSEVPEPSIMDPFCHKHGYFSVQFGICPVCHGDGK